MAIIVCPECGKEISNRAKSCIYCGFPIEPTEVQIGRYDPARKKKKGAFTEHSSGINSKAKKQFNPKGCLGLIIIVLTFSILSSIIVRDKEPRDENDNTSEMTNKSVPSKMTASETETQELSEVPEKSEEEKFADYVTDIVNYQKDMVSEDVEDAFREATNKGKWAAFTLNLKMYDSTSFKYHVCHYAMYGEEAYLKEVEGSQEYISKVQEYMSSLLLDQGIDEFNDYFRIQREKIAQEIADYKSSSETVSYEELVREPSKHEGKILKITLKISQVMGGGIITESGYAGKQNGNEWYVSYDLPDDVPRILEGDSITFYGEFNGVREMKRSLTGSKAYIPNLRAKYHVIN